MDNEKIDKIEALLDTVVSQNVQPDEVENLPQYTFTELGNAKRFVAIASDEFKWVPELKEWVHWTGKKWEVDTHAKIIRRYEDVLESLKEEMKPLGEELKEIAATPNAGIKDTTEYNRVKSIKQELKSISDWYTRSQFEKTIKSSLNLVRAQEGMTIAYSQFDSKGHFLGVSNGIVNLKTGELITRKSDYLVTKTAAVRYEPNVDCPIWKETLNKIMLGKKDYVDFLQVLLGSAAVGKDPKWFTMFYGEKGANGKSTLVDIVGAVLGDYAMVSDPTIITGKRFDEGYHLATYKGARFVVFNETDEDDVNLTSAIIKKVVDSGEIVGRHPMGRPFKFQPVFTPIFCVNHLPAASMDPALWRRLLIVPFDYQVPVDERDINFKDRLLKEEGEGILTWLVDGAKRFLADGLNPPSALLADTKKASCEIDIIGQFIEQRCVKDDESTELLNDVRKKFNEWAKDEGFSRQYSSQRFSREMKDRGYELYRAHGNVTGIRGIRAYSSLEDRGRAQRKVVKDSLRLLTACDEDGGELSI